MRWKQKEELKRFDQIVCIKYLATNTFASSVCLDTDKLSRAVEMKNFGIISQVNFLFHARLIYRHSCCFLNNEREPEDWDYNVARSRLMISIFYGLIQA